MRKKPETASIFVPEAEQPYQIPHNWRWTTLDKVAEWGSGGTPSRKIPAYYGGKIPWVKTGELNDGYIFNTEEKITDDAIAHSSAKMYPPNTVILAMYGATIGKVAVLGINATTNQACACALCNPFLLPLYLFYYLRSEKESFIKKAKGGAQPNISQAVIKKHAIPLPPLAEQQRIVDRIESLFSKLDAARDNAQAVVDGFELRKAAILHRAFFGELTRQWRENNGISLTSWENATLAKVVSGFRYGTSEKSGYSYPGMPVLRIPNIGDNGIDFSDMKFLNSAEVESANQVKENDILIIRSNGSRDLVGKCALIPPLTKPFAYASFLIKITPSDRINPRFLLLYLNSAAARAQMFLKAKSSAGIHNINSKELGAISIRLPDLREQAEIVSIAEDTLSKEEQSVNAAQQVIDNIDVMKKAILGRAFRGELGTNDPSEESPDFAVTV